MGEDTDPGTFTGAAAAACGRSGAAGANACLLSACVSAAAVSSAGTRPGGGRCGLLCAGHGPVFISETVYGTGGAAPGDAAHPDLHRDLPNAGASAADIVKRRGLLYDKAIYRANAAGKHPAPVFIAGARPFSVKYGACGGCCNPFSAEIGRRIPTDEFHTVLNGSF